VLVISHEFGHFIVARAFGVRVDEFGFGYPPRLAKLFKKGDTEYTLNWLPFGGFVKIFGENPDDENTNGPDKVRSFVHKPRYAQALILVAGVVFNLILAWLFLSIGFMSGLPSSVSSAPAGVTLQDQKLVVLDVVKNSPAQKAGLGAGDSIISLTSGKDVLSNPNPDNLREFVIAHGTSPITFDVKQKNEEKNISITPEKASADANPAIGIQMDTLGTLKLPFFKALGSGASETVHMTGAIAVSLYDLVRDSIRGKADFNSITGPVGIVGVVGQAKEFGFIYLLSFTALISINLAVINLIPFPALDGGRLLFILIEKIKGSRIKPAIANWLNTIGFSLLIILMLVVTYHDIAKLFVK
jgi:regulator of sigma E protease